eukprot:jgi/Bigna1/70354/fgenesh1_pg.11_\
MAPCRRPAGLLPLASFILISIFINCYPERRYLRSSMQANDALQGYNDTGIAKEWKTASRRGFAGVPGCRDKFRFDILSWIQRPLRKVCPPEGATALGLCRPYSQREPARKIPNFRKLQVKRRGELYQDPSTDPDQQQLSVSTDGGGPGVRLEPFSSDSDYNIPEIPPHWNTELRLARSFNATQAFLSIRTLSECLPEEIEEKERNVDDDEEEPPNSQFVCDGAIEEGQGGLDAAGGGGDDNPLDYDEDVIFERCSKNGIYQISRVEKFLESVNLYDILGISPNTTMQGVRKALYTVTRQLELDQYAEATSNPAAFIMRREQYNPIEVIMEGAPSQVSIRSWKDCMQKHNTSFLPKNTGWNNRTEQKYIDFWRSNFYSLVSVPQEVFRLAYIAGGMEDIMTDVWESVLCRKGDLFRVRHDNSLLDLMTFDQVVVSLYNKYKKDEKIPQTTKDKMLQTMEGFADDWGKWVPHMCRQCKKAVSEQEDYDIEKIFPDSVTREIFRRFVQSRGVEIKRRRRTVIVRYWHAVEELMSMLLMMMTVIDARIGDELTTEKEVKNISLSLTSSGATDTQEKQLLPTEEYGPTKASENGDSIARRAAGLGDGILGEPGDINAFDNLLNKSIISEDRLPDVLHSLRGVDEIEGVTRPARRRKSSHRSKKQIY